MIVTILDDVKSVREIDCKIELGMDWVGDSYEIRSGAGDFGS